jgi:thiosulfate/3-mercaptopyruvate sulfurtransferase
MTPAALVLAAVTAQRLGELVVAARNTRRLLDRGGVEAGRDHYPYMVALHAAWLLALWGFGRGRPVDPTWLTTFAVLQAARVWVVSSLGAHWTTRIITLPQAPLVRRGPYRFFAHPNYVVVTAEVAVLPLALGLPLVAILFSGLNAAMLRVRIRAEETALRRMPGVPTEAGPQPPKAFRPVQLDEMPQPASWDLGVGPRGASPKAAALRRPGDPMVSPAWLAARLGGPGLKVVDATLGPVGRLGRGRARYESGHIPGALFFDIEGMTAGGSRSPYRLPSPAAFAEAVAKLGLRRDAPIVVYDAHGVHSAARAWWSLRVMGFENVHVLDGGLKAWRAEGRPVEAGGGTAAAATSLAPALDPSLVCDLQGVREILRTRAAQVVDASPDASSLQDRAPNRAGPQLGSTDGVSTVPFPQLLTREGRLKDATALRVVFAGRGIDLADPIVTVCTSGIAACILALALARLGCGDVVVCDDAWRRTPAWRPAPPAEGDGGAAPGIIRAGQGSR